jgi:hypothetical protein
MVNSKFDSRVKIQQIIDSQIPEFILDENPKAAEFLKQYYISQEYQGGPIDIVENLDQYLKLDNLLPEVIVGFTSLTSGISSSSTNIVVNSTKGFPSKYGLLKIDDEIITYTGITTNTFTGCIRGFSGITNYHKNLQYEELVFSESVSEPHNFESKVENLSSLFLKEFYKKIKFTLTPGLEELNFNENLNVGNFIKESKSLYETKGTPESFRILFNVLFGETPKIINLEQFLIKSSDSDYIRRNVAVIKAISGDPTKLTGQTIKKSTDEGTSASVSEVETITRKSKTYYKLNFFVGYDDSYPNITGTFSVTPNTKVIDNVILSSTKTGVVTVDSTIGFAESGSFFYEDYEVFYSRKTINQFLGCYINSNESVNVLKKSLLISNETYYGYENGDLEKKVEFIITGVISDIFVSDNSYNFIEGDEIYPQNLGEIISQGKSNKQIFANSWIYNTSSRYQVDNFSGFTITIKSKIDSVSISVGDTIEILDRNTENVISTAIITGIDLNANQITINQNINLSGNYDIRRILKKANSPIVPIEFGNDKITSDIQNVYNENDAYMYVASNSLPSYQIQKNVFEYTITKLSGKNDDDEYSIIEFNDVISFITGDKVLYYTDENSTIVGLVEGPYFVEVLSDKKSIKLHLSSSTIGSSDFVTFGQFSNGSIVGNHKVILYSQKSKTISPQKLLKKFPLDRKTSDNKIYETIPGSIGMLKNGVEIYNYKTNDKIYYGPLENVDVLSGGNNYDVINPPVLTISTGSAVLYPVITGSVKKIFVDPQEFDIDVNISIQLSGGNGSNSSFKPIFEKYAREIEFDARSILNGGGIDSVDEVIAFKENHNLINGQPLVYNNNNFNSIGIGTFKGSNLDQGKTLVKNAIYYTEVINDKTIRLYQNFSDYSSGINTVGFTTIGNSGTHKFKTEVKNRLVDIQVISEGSGYSNRKIRVSPSGISTFDHTINFKNHGFSDGEVVSYEYQTSNISGLTTSNSYKVLKLNSDNFRICDIGIGGTDNSNFTRKNYVKFSSTGSGYQFFSYPKIILSVDYTSVGLGSTQVRGLINAVPLIRGSIEDVYIYEKGSDYGSLILNNHQRPQITIKNGREAELKPVIINGRITSVQVLYGGFEYYSTPDLLVLGNGVGASLRPVVTNNKISSIIVINSGAGYDENTTSIIAISAGQNAKLQPNIRSLTLNNSYKYGIQNALYRDPASEILVETENNLKYAIVGYTTHIKDAGNASTHSDIIGWAYDGNPIYGPYGYSDPYSSSSVKVLSSGYSKVTVENRPNFPEGYFVEDYAFTNAGDLDEYNGRFGKTKDFPNGTYAYFTTIESNNDGNNIGKFPYFIGNKYRSMNLNENSNLDQSFSFNSSNLIRNTTPYKVKEEYADNDFIVESNEIIEQKTLIESVSYGSVSELKILNSGSDYKVGDQINFESNDSGGGILAKVSEITGKEIEQIETTVDYYNDSVVTWENGNSINVHIYPYHNLSNKDIINISGVSTQVSVLDGSYQIGVTSYFAKLEKEIPAYSLTGIVTDIYLTSIPENISVGSSFKINNELFSILNIYNNYGVIRVSRETSGGIHTQSSSIYFLPDTFTINKLTEYFDSTVNSKVFFNPTKSVGIGTIVGVGTNVNYNIGITSYSEFIPTQSIFIPNHRFKTGQKVIFKKPTGGDSIAVSETPTSLSFNILSGSSEVLYVINKSLDYIGIVTNVGLTTNSSGLFFRNTTWNSGHDSYQYSIESDLNQIKVDISKIKSVVSVSTSHNLQIGDKISLRVNPNLNVGIGTSTSVKIKLDPLIQKIIINPTQFSSSGINTTSDTILLNSHSLNTGDKIIFNTLGSIPSGITTGCYFIYKVDNDNIKLCETYYDSVVNPPETLKLTTQGSGIHEISLINPKINQIKNNNLIFDLSDSSLSGYNFKIYSDKDFKKEFVSIENSNTKVVSGVGTVGVSTNASLTINYKDFVPEKIYYNLEKSGYISTADSEVNNYSEILFTDSLYYGTYNVSGIGTTTFTISLKNTPEKLNYYQSECDILKYNTTSKTSTGGISKINLLSGGYGYKSLPDFIGSNSLNGKGAFIIPYSNTIGKITKSRIINEGFEYSSDKTLRPTAAIPQVAYIASSNTIDTIDVLSGGKNYISPPDLILIDSSTEESINSGFLKAKLNGSSIGSVDIEIPPKGLPINPVTIKSINNTNGITIDKVQSSSSGIVTCFITTPLLGFSIQPFQPGDRIFVEGIEKTNSSGDGFNSPDHGYNFFEVKNYYALNPDKVEFDISDFTNNPGVAKTIQESNASIVNYKNYPEFKVIQKFSPFSIGEQLSSDNGFGFISRNLKVVDCRENVIRVVGSYSLSIGEKIRGLQSDNVAVIDSLSSTNGIYNTNSFNLQNFGWENDTGKLSYDTQVTPDNDYYQNLSYTVKSTKTWEEISSPVYDLLHTSGTKNFSDTQFIENAQSGIGTVESILSLVSMFVEENRVDTINNFDLVVDVDVIGNKSKFIKFEKVRLSDYILCKTNRVLQIDDISNEFSSSNDEIENVANILPLNSESGYNRFLVQVKNILSNEIQFNEIITLNDNENIFTLSVSEIVSNSTLANISGYVTEDNNFYLKFDPSDPYNSNYNIKILRDTFTSKTAIGSTENLNCVDLIAQNKVVASGITTSIISLDSSKYSSIYSNIHILNTNSSNMNYVQIYLVHDGTDTYISEYYFDDESYESYGFIGSFGASLNGGILSLNYTNTENENIIVRSKNIGFGSTSLGTDFYRFKLPGQIDGNERTVVFESNYNNVSSGSTSIFVLDKNLFNSVKSTVKIGVGQTSSLHQIMTVYDGSDIFITQYPFLSVGSTTGIGSFGATVDSTNIILNFYPDPLISEEKEIISFNECFYSDLDLVNLPPDLVYSPIRQSVSASKFYGKNSPFIDKLDFESYSNDIPIFMKTFDPITTIDISTGICTIPNHFFNTGERLIYNPKSTFIGIGTSAIGIGATENYVGIVTTLLPEVLYAIRIDSNTFRLATKKEYADQGIGVSFTSFGTGNAHELEMFKKNEKSLITINNLVQYPVTYSNVTHTLSGNDGQISAASTIFSLSGISSINPNDLLKVDNEYMKVTNVGLGTTNAGPITFSGDVPLVEVTRAFLGSSSGIHTDTSNVDIHRGSYNIFGNKIYFTEPPRGNQLDLIGPDESNLPRERATFTGRVFLRQDYTSNQIYDDISNQFTGIGQTFILTSQGINTVGLGTSGGNGIVFINNIFQSPTTLNNSNNNYIIEEDTAVGISSILFTGVSSNSGLFISDYDINMNQLPRGGIIVSLGSTPGLGYAPLVGSSVTAVIGVGGSIVSVGLGTMDIIGSGYNGVVSVAVTEYGHSGSVANIIASVGAGGTLSFNIIDGGSGYSEPMINISSPSYENLPIIGVSRIGIGTTTDTGTGLLLNVEVGASSTTGIGSTLFEVTNFKIVRNGYSFRRGDVFKPIGLVTALGLSEPISEFELTVLDTFTDSFAAWQFGELDYIDSVKNYQDGIRTRFPLYYNSDLLSFEVDSGVNDSQLIDLASVLLIFINGIPQEPNISYEFSGGTSFTFTTAPKPEDNISIFFYRGTRDQDSLLFNITETIKVGDTVQIYSNNKNINNTITQNKRIVSNISGSDKIQTETYTYQGIDSVNKKPLYWTKQKIDLEINGDIVYKSRESIEPQIYPTASIIKNFNPSDGEIFVDSASLFNYERQTSDQFDCIIFSNNNVGIATTNFSTQYEKITDINMSGLRGFDASITGIGTTSGIGAPLAIKFQINIPSVNSVNQYGDISDLQVGYPIYISNTIVGSGVTSINTNDSDVLAISTSHLNNIYFVHAFDSVTGIITCNIHSNTSIVGVATTGSLNYPVGKISWGKLSGFTRSSSPISIAITGAVSSIGISTEGYGAGLSTYPFIQRRNIGFNDNGSIIKDNLLNSADF